MLVLPGSSAITQSRRNVLLKAFQASIPSITSVDAVHLHLVNASSTESEELLGNSASPERGVLNALLAYGDDERLPSTKSYLEEGNSNVFAVYVMPRSGTISPWSSKATDIAKICRLGDHVTRIERGAGNYTTQHPRSPFGPTLDS
jgi:phosphoribosylformylglycinamidine synthase